MQQDGLSYFFINNFRLGYVGLRKALDYESLRAVNTTTFFLNVSAEDVYGLATFTTLTLRVTDVDDLPPEFNHPNCSLQIVRSKPCVVSYEARITVKFMGLLTDITPAPIGARDMDFLDATIIYSLEVAPGENPDFLKKFFINATTGSVHLVSPFTQPQVVHLIIVARQAERLSRLTQATFTVTVFEDKNQFMVDQLKPLLDATANRENGDSGKVPPLYMIITLVFGILSLLVHFIICMLCWIHKTKQHQRVSPMPSKETGSCTSLGYKHQDSLVSLNAKQPQAALLHTCFCPKSSKLSIGKEDTVAKAGIKYAPKGHLGLANADHNTSHLAFIRLKGNTKRYSAEDRQAYKGPVSIITGEKYHSNSRNFTQNTIAEGHSCDQSGDHNDFPIFYPNQDETEEEHKDSLFTASPTSVCTDFSSDSTRPHAYSSRDDENEFVKLGESVPIQELNSTLNSQQPLQSSCDKLESNALQDTKGNPSILPSFASETYNYTCTDGDGLENPTQKTLCSQSSLEFKEKEDGNNSVTVGQKKIPVTGASHEAKSVKVDTDLPTQLEKKHVNNCSDANKYATKTNTSIGMERRDHISGHGTLSHAPWELVSINTEDNNLETDAIFRGKQLALQVRSDNDSVVHGRPFQMPQVMNPTQNNMIQWQTTDFLMFRPHTGPGHHTRPHTEPIEYLDESTTAKVQVGEGQRPETNLSLERKRVRGKNKKRRGDRDPKKPDSFDHGVTTDALAFDYPLSCLSHVQDTAEEYQMKNGLDEHNLPNRNAHSACMHHHWRINSHVPESISALESCNSLCGSVVDMRKSSGSDLKKNNAFLRAKRLAKSQQKTVMLDGSRLQPYMILQHVKQKREWRQQQFCREQEHQRERQTRKQLKPNGQMQPQYRTEQRYKLKHEHLFRRHSASQQGQLQRRTVSECLTLSKSKEQLPVPATAPALLNSEDSHTDNREQDSDEEVNQDVQNWVNSTH
ncbi:protocadherin-15 [Plakobranchus ocellatus]|uniref:Protocadherin-15 n=1 Tax=Plakobranchus ocellatus TaxID=259542 RepID=A0AAV4AGU0_9GAST|nr:protocadherin-15 [Plakobranchus ocellatus]